MFIVKPGVNIINTLKTAGYSTYRIHKEGIFGSAVMQKFRNGGLPSWAELYKICMLCHVAPVDIIAIQLDNGAIFDLTGKVRLDKPPAIEPIHYDCDDDTPPAIPPEYIR